MSDTMLAAISTLAWVALVGVIVGLFGREEGGAWSIAGGVARGVRDWSSGRRREGRRVSSSPASPESSSASTSLSSSSSRRGASPSSSPRAEVEDLL